MISCIGWKPSRDRNSMVVSLGACTLEIAVGFQSTVLILKVILEIPIVMMSVPSPNKALQPTACRYAARCG